MLLIGGGETHVGAVAVGAQENTSLMVIPPHKEGPLARDCAAALAERSGRTCVAVAGIHLDEISKEEILAIQENVKIALDHLLEAVFPQN